MTTKSLTTAIATAALIGGIGLAYAQTSDTAQPSTETQSATPSSESSTQSTMPSASSDTPSTPSATTSDSAATTEPAPRADRN